MEDALYKQLERGDLGKVSTYQIGVLQSSVNRSLQKHSDAILKQFGLTKMQWLIIGTLRDSGTSGMRLTDLSKIVGTTLPYLTNAVNLLESRGILLRTSHSADNRAKVIYINPTFVPQYQEIEETMRNALRKSIYSQVDPAEFRTYLKVLYQLSKVS